jgi:integrase
MAQDDDPLAAGSSWAANDLVFATSFGTPNEPRNLTRQFFGGPGRAELGDLMLHDLLHTCITLLLSPGTPGHTVHATAGHRHIDATMSIHGHNTVKEQRKALNG